MCTLFHRINEYMPLLRTCFIDLINKASELHFEELLLFSPLTKEFHFGIFLFPLITLVTTACNKSYKLV